MLLIFELSLFELPVTNSFTIHFAVVEHSKHYLQFPRSGQAQLSRVLSFNQVATQDWTFLSGGFVKASNRESAEREASVKFTRQVTVTFHRLCYNPSYRNKSQD